MPRMNKLSTYRTTIASQGEHMAVTYVNTAIVKFSTTEIILNTGGYRSVTTKRKMNQTARQFNLPYGVTQRKGDWYITRHDPVTGYYMEGHDVPFNGRAMRLDRATGIWEEVQ